MDWGTHAVALLSTISLIQMPINKVEDIDNKYRHVLKQGSEF